MSTVFGSQRDTLRLFAGESPRALQLLDAADPTGARRTRAAIHTPTGDQFRILNLDADDNGAAVFRDPHDTKPKLTGSDDLPDVRAKVEMVAFHPGSNTAGAPESATLRLDIAQDDLSSSQLQPLFWSIAAGLDLAEAMNNKKKDAPKDYRYDFQRSFTHRPIEIGGGLANIRFEVVAHEAPPWWKQIFSFATGRTGKAMINVLGFPGIVGEAVQLIDNALNQLQEAKPKVLFRSAPMTFALSERARSDYTLGSPGVIVGALNQGYSLLLPHRHFKTVLEQKPRFFAGLGRLIPEGRTPLDFAADDYDDPFADIPYTVLKIRLESAALASKL